MTPPPPSSLVPLFWMLFDAASFSVSLQFTTLQPHKATGWHPQYLLSMCKGFQACKGKGIHPVVCPPMAAPPTNWLWEGTRGETLQDCVNCSFKRGGGGFFLWEGQPPTLQPCARRSSLRALPAAHNVLNKNELTMLLLKAHHLELTCAESDQ